MTRRPITSTGQGGGELAYWLESDPRGRPLRLARRTTAGGAGLEVRGQGDRTWAPDPDLGEEDLERSSAWRPVSELEALDVLWDWREE